MKRWAPKRRWDGFSLTELVMVLALLGLTAIVSAIVWHSSRQRAELVSAAQTVKIGVHQARLLSIYRGVNHFVVLDPSGHTLEIYEDSNAPLGSFDAGDTRVSGTQWPGSVTLSLPVQPSPLADPQTGTTVSDAWNLPLPDASARWGSALRGVMTTPDGQLLSAAATPQVIGLGSIVLTNVDDQSGAVALDGRAGAVRTFELHGSSWEEL